MTASTRYWWTISSAAQTTCRPMMNTTVWICSPASTLARGASVTSAPGIKTTAVPGTGIPPISICSAASAPSTVTLWWVRVHRSTVSSTACRLPVFSWPPIRRCCRKVCAAMRQLFAVSPEPMPASSLNKTAIRYTRPMSLPGRLKSPICTRAAVAATFTSQWRNPTDRNKNLSCRSPPCRWWSVRISWNMRSHLVNIARTMAESMKRRLPKPPRPTASPAAWRYMAACRRLRDIRRCRQGLAITLVNWAPPRQTSPRPGQKWKRMKRPPDSPGVFVTGKTFLKRVQTWPSPATATPLADFILSQRSWIATLMTATTLRARCATVPIWRLTKAWVKVSVACR